jgi:hypothetical protein
MLANDFQGTLNLLSFSVLFPDNGENIGEKVTYDVSTPEKREGSSSPCTKGATSDMNSSSPSRTVP